jgi:hypothetical protein
MRQLQSRHSHMWRIPKPSHEGYRHRSVFTSSRFLMDGFSCCFTEIYRNTILYKNLRQRDTLPVYRYATRCRIMRGYTHRAAIYCAHELIGIVAARYEPAQSS